MYPISRNQGLGWELGGNDGKQNGFRQFIIALSFSVLFFDN